MSDDSTESTMLGTYTLDGDVPADPQIVLTNCQDTNMLGQLVTLFGASPDIRFFLIQEGDNIDPSMDFHFIKDGGTWRLGSNDTMTTVLFDDAGFNPGGKETTFSIIQSEDGNYTIGTGDMPGIETIDHFLVDMSADNLFNEAPLTDNEMDGDSFFVDPSVLHAGENEIVVNNFILGSDSLELPEGMSVKDVIITADNNFTEVIIGQDDEAMGQSDIIVRLLGVSQSDMPFAEYVAENDNITDDIINQLINSGISLE